MGAISGGSTPAFIGSLWRIFEAKDRMEARMARGPGLEQVDGVDATFRVVSYSMKGRSVIAVACAYQEAIAIADRSWRDNRSLDKVCVVDERTGIATDEIWRVVGMGTGRA